MVIFDLDQTLIDSRIAGPERQARNWSGVYKLIPHFTVYDGVLELLCGLRDRGVPHTIVTSTPRPYCEKVVDHWGFEIPRNLMVCYHDTRAHKPSPEPILLGLQKLGARSGEGAHVGDDEKDTPAAKAAGVTAIGALWGAVDAEGLSASSPDQLFQTVGELEQYLSLRFPG